MAQQQLRTMSASALLDLRGKIDALLAGKREELERQLALFQSTLGKGDARIGKGGPVKSSGKSRKGKRGKAAPQFRSKKNPKVVWSGRGMTPIWMREEMKGTKLKKEDFRIKL